MRDNNLAVFQETAQLCKTNERLKQAIQASSKQQKIYLETDSILVNKNRFEGVAKIICSKKRSFEAAREYKDQSVAALNFASATNPGGGVTKGSSAQEESLCRCSTLYFNLNEQKNWDKFYDPHRRLHNQLYNDDAIYTPGVIVFRNDATGAIFLEEQWQTIDIISCAAPNLRDRNTNGAIRVNPTEIQTLHERRARRILDIAVANGNDVVVLGAFGCGAFLNRPDTVARAYRNILPEYAHAFKVIEFAIYCTPRDESNYVGFKRMLPR